MKAFWFLLAAALVMLLLILPLRLVGSHTPREEPRPGEYRLAEALRLAEDDGKCVVVYFDVQPGQKTVETNEIESECLALIDRKSIGDPEVQEWLREHAYFVRSSSFSRSEANRFDKSIRPLSPHKYRPLWVIPPDMPPRSTSCFHPRYVRSFLEAARTNVPPIRESEFEDALFEQAVQRKGVLKRRLPDPATIEEARQYTALWRDVNLLRPLGSVRPIRIGDLRHNRFVRQAFDELRREFMAEYEDGSFIGAERWASITMVELQERDEALAFIIPILDDPAAAPGLQRVLFEIDIDAVIEAGRPDLFVKLNYWGLLPERDESHEHDWMIAQYEHEWGVREGHRERRGSEEFMEHFEFRLAALHTGQLMLGRGADAESTLKALAASPGSERLVPAAIAMAAKLDQLRPMHLEHLDPDNPDHAAWIEKIRRDP